MEAITQLVAESLARHGFDRPVDPRRLQWSRWFRCDSPRSLLVVPSKPGIFAIAEEVAALCGASEPRSRNPERSEGSPAANSALADAILGGAALQRCDSLPPKNAASAADPPQRRMLAVLQFSEDDDMAFTLDRMFTRINPMRARLSSGGCFLRFVVIADQDQRRSICSALNQWMLSSAEKASGIPAGFSSSLEVSTAEEVLGTTRVGRTLLSAHADTLPAPAPAAEPPRGADLNPLPHLDTGANKNLHRPHPLPSGF
ncbi:MAG: hypothetical protein WB714_00870 [Candidatus Sulfotelmatobacter sp.]